MSKGWQSMAFMMIVLSFRSTIIPVERMNGIPRIALTVTFGPVATMRDVVCPS